MFPVMTAGAIRLKINKLLSQKGLTMADMAKSIGRSYGGVRNTVCGVERWKPTRRAIEQFLGVTLWNESKTETADD
jgi:lambda repressor-like predicted transcriptional regulator